MSGDILLGIDAGTSAMSSIGFDTTGRELAVASVRSGFEKWPRRRGDPVARCHLGPPGRDAAGVAGPQRPTCGAHAGGGDHRAGRRHFADRRGRRTGWQRLAVAGQPRGRHRRRLASRAGGGSTLRGHRHRAYGAPAGTAAALDAAPRTKPAGLRRHRLSLQDWLDSRMTRVRAPDPCELGYMLVLPVPVQVAQMRTNMAATPNIPSPAR